MNIQSQITIYNQMRESLIAQYPELADDIQALDDTLEGETGLQDALASIIRGARWKQAQADGCRALIKDMQGRVARLENSSDNMQDAVLVAMQSAGIRKISAPDFTVSIRKVGPKVIIIDEAALPDSMCRITRQPDKAEIRGRLEAGEIIEGACLSNGGETLSVRP
jgi:hypothetical protein